MNSAAEGGWEAGSTVFAPEEINGDRNPVKLIGEGRQLRGGGTPPCCPYPMTQPGSEGRDFGRQQ